MEEQGGNFLSRLNPFKRKPDQPTPPNKLVPEHEPPAQPAPPSELSSEQKPPHNQSRFDRSRQINLAVWEILEKYNHPRQEVTEFTDQNVNQVIDYLSKLTQEFVGHGDEQLTLHWLPDHLDLDQQAHDIWPVVDSVDLVNFPNLKGEPEAVIRTELTYQPHDPDTHQPLRVPVYFHQSAVARDCAIGIGTPEYIAEKGYQITPIATNPLHKKLEPPEPSPTIIQAPANSTHPPKRLHD